MHMYAYIYEHIMELHISNSLRKCELAMGIYIRFILFFFQRGWWLDEVSYK